MGRQLLNEEIYCLCDTGLIASDYLLYYYYGGLVCTALKEHARALKLFEMAITIPTAVPDAIIIAAWHRYQIITALSQGALLFLVATCPCHAIMQSLAPQLFNTTASVAQHHGHLSDDRMVFGVRRYLYPHGS